MKIYADQPARLVRQSAGDAFFLVWIGFWVWFATFVYDAVAALGEPGRQLESGGEGMAGFLQDAGDRAANLPLIGDRLSGPFDGAGDAAESLAQAGRELQDAVNLLALLLALVVSVIPVLLAVLLWVPARVRFVRRATAARRFVDAEADLDLFALRALARQPMHVLARIDDDPAGAWRRGDARVVHALAAAELRSVGLRLPPQITSA